MRRVIRASALCAFVLACDVAFAETGQTLPGLQTAGGGQAASTTVDVGASREISILTYNIHGLPWPLTRNPTSAFREIGRELGQMRREGRAPDIVLIQEGFSDISELVQLSGYAYWARGPEKAQRPPDEAKSGFARTRYLVKGEGWGKLTGSGLHVLSDLPITSVRTESYRYCAGWDCLANKGVMAVHVEVEGLSRGLDVVNTHMNSREAAKVPWSRSRKAHNLQMTALLRFVARTRTPGAALLVGGDLNARDDPGRYYYQAEQRPFTVVAEECKHRIDSCGAPEVHKPAEPWLSTEDLQAYSSGAQVTVAPMRVALMFNGTANGSRLSDHDGYQVRYLLRPAGLVRSAVLSLATIAP